MGQPLGEAPSMQIEQNKTVPSFQFSVGSLFFPNKQAKKSPFHKMGLKVFVGFLSDLICAYSILLIEMCISLINNIFLNQPMFPTQFEAILKL